MDILYTVFIPEVGSVGRTLRLSVVAILGFAREVKTVATSQPTAKMSVCR